MKFLDNLISPIGNCEVATFMLCRELGISITQTTITKELLEHPDYPSLLSISDLLTMYGADNKSFKMSYMDLSQLDRPFLVQVQDKKSQGGKLFAVIRRFSETQVDWINPKTFQKEAIPSDYFLEIFTGYVLVVDPSGSMEEEEFRVKLNRENRQRILNNLVAVFIPIVSTFICVVTIINGGYSTIFSVLYVIASLIGATTCVLLILYEIDQYNPILQKVCTGGGRTNCAAILQSKGSKIFGISWSILGFSYFMGVLTVLIAGGLFSVRLLSTAAWINVLVIPYTIYSIYYQGKVVKQWCPMCLTIQFVLVCLFTISLFGNFLNIQSLSFFSILPYAVSISIIFLMLYTLFPSLQEVRNTKQIVNDFQRVKHDPQIFNTLLTKQKQITEPTMGLGITLGNPNGKIHLIKICNPYCFHCSTAHSVLEKMMKLNAEIKLQIIFMVTENENDIRNKPVKTFLALYHSSPNPEEFIQALNSWYLGDGITYEQLNTLYPLPTRVLEEQKERIKKMREWCKLEEINATPTLFVNNYQLPDIYSVADLRYFLST